MAIKLNDEIFMKKFFNNIIEHLSEIEGLFSHEYYYLLTGEDVDFLAKYQDLNKYTHKQKMVIYHIAIMYIVTEALLSVMQRKDILIDYKIIYKICPCYQYVYNNEISKVCNNTFDDMNWDEIENSLISSQTDYLNLLSQKSSGTEITPRSIADFMLDCISYEGEKILDSTLLEPACGTGMFLSSVIKRILKECKKNDLSLISDLLTVKKKIVAFDINPLNIYISKIVTVINIINEFKNVNIEYIIKIIIGLPFYANDILRANISEFDYVIGNPPYIRLQNLSLELRKYIKSNYVSSTGRFDIYVCFIEIAIKALKKDGKISFITSNKYFTANYGIGIRNFISKNLEIDFLFDLSDTKYFKAAVLPAIITGHRKEKPSNDEIAFCHIKIDAVERQERKIVGDIFAFTKEILGLATNHKAFYTINNYRNNIPIEFVFSKVSLPSEAKQWNFNSEKSSLIKEKIENIGICTLDELFDICVGIKTTADDVFVKPMNKTFIEEHGFESELIYPIIQSFNTEKWFVNWSPDNEKDKYILYPHVEINGKSFAADLVKYPNCAKYLYENREKLESRTYLTESKTRMWYECWVPQTLEKFRKMKIVTRDIVSHNSFALDLKGQHCQGNTFFLNFKDNSIAKLNFNRNETDFLYYILGILNSNVLEYYQKLISGSLYSKKFRYTTTNLSRWPIPRISSEENVDRIIKIVNLIINEGISNLECEKELNQLVYSIYGLEQKEVDEIESFLKANT